MFGSRRIARKSIREPSASIGNWPQRCPIAFDFDEKAACPRWEQFLEEVFPGDLESQITAEEQLGYGMTTDTRFEKGAAWIGEKRSGKSTLAWVQEMLCGAGSCVSLSFHDWTKTENSHEHLIGRKVGIFSDVRLKPGKWYGQNYDPGGLDHDSKQLILKITGRDRITIKRKYLSPWITGANQLIRQINKIDRWSWLGSIQPSNTRVYPGIKKKAP